MSADILQTHPSDWKYVSEGGATIVFSYKGPPHPHFDGTVLRLRKSIVPPAGSRNRAVPPSDATQSVEEEPDDPTIEYQMKCMERLLPKEHLPRLETVRLDRSWLEELEKLQNAIRPQERREKDEVDLNRKKGVLATDLVGGEWLAVEIKPKWGFLPSSTHLSEATKSVKMQTCRFCMHSHMRGKQDMTDYCPLDLFSGDEVRVLTALNKLWDGWVASDATLNNLKIFAGGKFVRPSEASLMLADGVDREQIGLGSIKEAFGLALTRSLTQTPVLRILSELQRDLDALDIEGLSKLWHKTESSAPLYRTTFAPFFQQGSTSEPPPTPLGVSSLFLQAPEPAIPDWEEFLDTYLLNKPDLDHSNPSPEHLRYYLLAYLLSATFKDCSVIVRLDFLQPGTTPEGEVKPQTVTVIDLDPKSMDKLSNWEKLDKKIVQSYASVQSKVCVDKWRKSLGK